MTAIIQLKALSKHYKVPVRKAGLAASPSRESLDVYADPHFRQRNVFLSIGLVRNPSHPAFLHCSTPSFIPAVVTIMTGMDRSSGSALRAAQQVAPSISGMFRSM